MANKVIKSSQLKIWIDGKIFPIQKLKEIRKKTIKEQDQDSSPPETDQIDEEHLTLFNITEENGRFTTNINISKLYCSKIQNLPGFSVKKLSKETQTDIVIPKLNQKGGITLHSDRSDSLVKAVRHIHSALYEVRGRNIALQFTCIPCLNPVIKEQFENLKKEILAMDKEIEGLHESIFISPSKLHVTIDVFSFLDDREKAEAVKALNEYKTNLKELVEKYGPLKLDIRGLDCMNDNIKKVDVLFANVKILNETEEHNLQKVVNDISQHFYHRGLARNYQENVKIHMTIINTKYRKSTESPKRKRRRVSIDATKIMEKFKDFNFGQCDFNSVHLSHISLKGEDGFYKPLAVIDLNEDNKDEQHI